VPYEHDMCLKAPGETAEQGLRGRPVQRRKVHSNAAEECFPDVKPRRPVFR